MHINFYRYTIIKIQFKKVYFSSRVQSIESSLYERFCKTLLSQGEHYYYRASSVVKHYFMQQKILCPLKG